MATPKNEKSLRNKDHNAISGEAVLVLNLPNLFRCIPRQKVPDHG